MSGFCCVCHVFPPLVSIYGLFPVLVSCHYELSKFQLCLSHYVLITLCILVLSFEFDFEFFFFFLREREPGLDFILHFVCGSRP